MWLGNDNDNTETINTDPYVSYTVYDTYEIDINVDRTGIEDIDNEMIVYLQALEAQLLDMASTTDASTMVAPYTLSATSETFADSRSGLQTTLVSVYQYTGGAHGMPLYGAWTYDVDMAEPYELNNILRNETDTLEYLYVQVQALEGVEGTDAQWLADGSGTNWDNYTLFRVQEGGIVIMFPPYQIAPYATGMVELPLSWEELAPYMRGGIANDLGLDNTPPSAPSASTTAVVQ